MISRSGHEEFMRECFRLAEKGKGYVSPNPLVGAVLAVNNTIVARGYHQRFGGPHAEVRCVRNYKGSLSNAILYVNLEPCSYYGKTPPCAELIVQRGIKRVVVAMKDPNPDVSGKGIARLVRAGVEVQVGVLEEEAKHLNRFFVKHVITKMPYVHLKIAQSMDGFIGRSKGPMQYITSAPSRKLVHRWRTEYDAVLVGAGTIKADNPQLNVRLVKGREPAVVILDGKLSVSGKEKVFASARERRVLVCADSSAVESRQRKVRAMMAQGVDILKFPSRNNSLNLKSVLKELYKHNIGSILVEGGSQVFNQLVLQGMVDEFSFFFAPKHFGSGVKGLLQEASVKAGRCILNNEFISYKVGSDSLITGIVRRR